MNKSHDNGSANQGTSLEYKCSASAKALMGSRGGPNLNFRLRSWFKRSILERRSTDQASEASVFPSLAEGAVCCRRRRFRRLTGHEENTLLLITRAHSTPILRDAAPNTRSRRCGFPGFPMPPICLPTGGIRTRNRMIVGLTLLGRVAARPQHSETPSVPQASREPASGIGEIGCP